MTNFRHTGYTWYTFWLPLRRANEQTANTSNMLAFMVWKLANVPGSRCLRHTWACLDRAQCAPSECKLLWRKDMILQNLTSHIDIDPTNLVKSDETPCVPVTLYIVDINPKSAATPKDHLDPAKTDRSLFPQDHGYVTSSSPSKGRMVTGTGKRMESLTPGRPRPPIGYGTNDLFPTRL